TELRSLVLHTNYPGRSDFNLYIKWIFVISVGEERVRKKQTEVETRSPQEKKKKKKKITSRTNWEQVTCLVDIKSYINSWSVYIYIYIYMYFTI
ncbi:unnamed protein product, partial [Brassica oleracea]